MKLWTNPRAWLAAGVAGAGVGLAFILVVGAVHVATPALFVGGITAGLTFAGLCLARQARP